MSTAASYVTLCAKCEGRTQFNKVYTGRKMGTERSGVAYYVAAIECVVCGLVMPAVIDDEGEFQPVDRAQLTYVSFEDVPGDIAGAASEAHLGMSAGAYRSAVILARAVIEATAKNKGFANGNLIAKIEAMAEAGVIRDYIKDGAHEVRHFGNDMAHGDFSVPASRADVALALELMDKVLDEVFQSPAQVQRARDRRMGETDT